MPASIGQLTQADRLLYGAQDWWQTTVRELGNGHVESVTRKHTTLSELPAWWGKSKTERWDRELGEFVDDGPTARGEGDLVASRAASAKRARRAMRLRCKSLGLDVLGTLTYQENIQDRAVVLGHWKEFVRRLRRVLPGFAYVAVLEVQKRGALHVHFATRRLPRELQKDGVRVKSYNLIRAIWRSVIGGVGAFHDSSRKTRGSVLKVSKYIAKYVGKSFEQVHQVNKRQYFAGGEWSAPIVTRRLFPAEGVLDAYTWADSFHGSGEQEFFQDTRLGLLWVASYSPPPPI
jgi:hypothetical protein